MKGLGAAAVTFLRAQQFVRVRAIVPRQQNEAAKNRVARLHDLAGAVDGPRAMAFTTRQGPVPHVTELLCYHLERERNPRDFLSIPISHFQNCRSDWTRYGRPLHSIVLPFVGSRTAT